MGYSRWEDGVSRALPSPVLQTLPKLYQPKSKDHVRALGPIDITTPTRQLISYVLLLRKVCRSAQLPLEVLPVQGRQQTVGREERRVRSRWVLLVQRESLKRSLSF